MHPAELLTCYQGPDTADRGAIPGRSWASTISRQPRALPEVLPCFPAPNKQGELFQGLQTKAWSQPEPALALCYLHLAMFNSRSQFLANWARKLFERVGVWLAAGKPWVVISCSCYLATFIFIRETNAGGFSSRHLFFLVWEVCKRAGRWTVNRGHQPSCCLKPQAVDGLVAVARSRTWALRFLPLDTRHGGTLAHNPWEKQPELCFPRFWP